MGLWRWLVGPRERGVVIGDHEFQFHVVGSSYHQQALEKLCGGRTPAGAHRYCAALLTPQPGNRYDRHAIAVTIHAQEVGFLDREDARDFGRALHKAGFADAACGALIVGGWDRGGHDWGYFGVRLNASLPFNFCSASEWSYRGMSLAEKRH